MADRYEYYIEGDDAAATIKQDDWAAQTFTPATGHKITSVKLFLTRWGSPGELTVGIRGTDGEGDPLDEDLCSGTTDGDTLTLGSPYEWREITLGDGFVLSADTVYAIVARALDSGAYAWVLWRYDQSTPTYAGGVNCVSDDAGESWTQYSGRDFLFEDWGEPGFTLHELVVTDGIALADVLGKHTEKVITDGITLGDVLGKHTAKVLTDGIRFADVHEGYKLLVLIVSDGIAIGESLVKSVVKVISDGIAVGESLVKSTIKVLSDGIKVGEILLKWRWLRPLRRLLPFRILESEREEPTE